MTLASDADLVAYLDGELAEPQRGLLESRLAADPALKARLELLAAGKRSFAEAFVPLLAAAPSERLGRLLAGAAATLAARTAGEARRRNRRLAQIAAAIVLFLAGAAVGIGVPKLLPAGSPSEAIADGWRAVVAEYLTLYTSDTLAGIPDDPALRGQELAAVGGKLAIDLTVDKVNLPGLALKRSQIFTLDGKPLAQIAYLTPDGPLAFCIIADGTAERAPRFEQRQGRNIVYWSKGGREFMLIGKTPRPQIEILAASLAERVG
jgi:anti-sigma factor RsiW